jgi:ribosomal protein L11 methyltransferase
MAKEHVEVSIPTSIDAGELLGILQDFACLGGVEEEGGLVLYWAKDSWNEATCNEVKRVLRQLGDAAAAEALSIRELPDQDWNACWAASLQPIRLGRRIFVRQSWNAVSAPEDAVTLVIDPKRAFGTGYHATTQLVVSWLEDRIRGGERVLDVGTGSGILAMVALRLGAKHALGLDNDPEAIECAREYALVNGFGPELELRVATLEESDPAPFDLLLANLDRKALLKHFEAFHMWLKPGVGALVSGLQREDYPEIYEALRTSGWEVAGLREKEEWLALELRPLGKSGVRKGT